MFIVSHAAATIIVERSAENAQERAPDFLLYFRKRGFFGADHFPETGRSNLKVKSARLTFSGKLIFDR